MKSASEAARLAKHRDQALTYWREAADAEQGIPAPEYVVQRDAAITLVEEVGEWAATQLCRKLGPEIGP